MSRHVGSVFYIESNSHWWANECGSYLLSEYWDGMGLKISNYQRKHRVYLDEFIKEGTLNDTV